MKIVVFDTETTGLPSGKNPSFYDSSAWPYIVQLSWIWFDTDTNSSIVHDHIIKIEGEISEDAYKIHGISTRYSHLRGENLSDVMDLFDKDVQNSDIIIGHNIQFDKNIYIAEAIRNNRIAPFNINSVPRAEYCTMKKTIKFCNMTAMNAQGKPYKKFPKLSELHDKIFGYIPSNLHNSLIDCLICLRCYGMLQYGIDFIKINSKLNRVYKLIENH